MKYLPSVLRPGQEANAESLNRSFRRVEEVLSSPAGDNFQDETFTWENVDLSETMRVALVYDDTEDPLVPDADHYTCTAYDTTTGLYDGVGGDVIRFRLEWSPLTVRTQRVSLTRNLRAGVAHVIFSGQVSSDGNWPSSIQFALRVDGNVLQETAWGGLASTQDPMAGYSQTEFPVMIQALMPVFDGEHTVEVVYRYVTSWQDADEKVATFRVMCYELILMELGGAG